MIRLPSGSILCLALVSVSARGTVATAAPTAAKVRVIRVDADPVEGAVVRLDPKELVLEGVAEPLPLASVREIRFTPDPPARPIVASAQGLRVVLRSGDVVRGALEAATAEELTLAPQDFPPMHINFDAIRRVEAELPDRGPCDGQVGDHPARKGTDLVYLRTGDAFAGTLAEATTKGIVMEGNGTKRSLAWSDVVVLHLDGSEPKEPSGLVAEIETVGGSMLLGTDATGGVDGVRMTLGSGIKVSIARGALTAIRWSGGAFARVETLPFDAKYVHHFDDPKQDAALIEFWWTARVDRTRERGCPLRIAKVAYRHGIAVHAKTIITIPLAKAYRRFSSWFGIDDEVFMSRDSGSPGAGNVTARVLVDGKEAWTSKGEVKGGEPARSVGPIDVTGAETLVLEVDESGDFAMLLARADWADPILVRAP